MDKCSAYMHHHFFILLLGGFLNLSVQVSLLKPIVF